jgi:hypothetical protein
VCCTDTTIPNWPSRKRARPKQGKEPKHKKPHKKYGITTQASASFREGREAGNSRKPKEEYETPETIEKVMYTYINIIYIYMEREFRKREREQKRTVTLFVACGIIGTPRAMVVRECVREWFDLLREASISLINDVQAAWSKAREYLLDHNCNIGGVHGIMSNIIYILLKAQWKPRTYNCWEDQEGATWAIVNFKSSPDVVASAISDSPLPF